VDHRPAPHISLCIPAYQAERHLRATLGCAVAQTAPDLEIVVLDNASTDRTAEILAEMHDPRLRVETNTTVLPLPANWNRLVKLSRGDLVKVLCADDLIHPDAVRQQAQILDSDAAVSLVASRRHLIDDEGRVLAANQGLRGLVGRRSGRDVAARVVRSGGNPIGEPGSVMFRRRDFDRVGGFDGDLLFPMDLDLWVRLLAHGDFLGMAESLAAFRAGSGSVSAVRSRAQYTEQLQLTSRVALDPRWRISTVDRMIGRAAAPLARLRRELLFVTAGWSRRPTLSRSPSSELTEWHS